MITGINESKTLTKHISCECKCRFDGKKHKFNQKWNNYKCRSECKIHHICGKDFIQNPASCSCKNGNYLASIIDNSVITCDEITDAEEKETISTNFKEKKTNCKTQNFYTLIEFLLIAIALLIAVSIYCYLIKYQAKPKDLLRFHLTNSELII